MTQQALSHRPDAETPHDRRAHILDAAERCFVRSGFHRTTMQDVAAEASMSPGNLYRYFRSKEAIVVGLAERDRAGIIEDFATVSGGSLIGNFAKLARKYFEQEPRERAILCLEIWAEATRNQAFAEITRDFDRDVVSRMAALFRQAQERGEIAAVDAEGLAILISTLANGLFVRRAVAPSFDAEREVGYLIAIMEAAFAGKLDLTARASTQKASEETAA
jgi:AcrR family transcriptional regulator